MDNDILIIGIENWTTGQRPNGIDNDDIRDGNLISPAGSMHQRLRSEEGGDFEVRVVKDDRDISQYEGSWTLHFDDGSAYDQGNWKSAIAQAFNSGKELVDVDGVLPIPSKDVNIANQIIKNGLLPQYNGDRERVEEWGIENGVDLPVAGRDMLKEAYKKGCPHVEKREPPEVN